MSTRRRLMFCLGAMRVTLSYLTPTEQVYMQSLSHWWYDVGVGRVQAHLVIRKPKNHYNKILKLGSTPARTEYLVTSKRDNNSLCRVTNLSKAESKKEYVKIVKQISSGLRHPNLCRFIEMFKTRKQDVCLVKEFSEGDITLKEEFDRRSILRSTTPEKAFFTEKELLKMIVQICLGVKYILGELPSNGPVKCAEITIQDVYLSKSGLVKLGNPFEAINLSDESKVNEYFQRYQKEQRLSSTPPEQVSNKHGTPISPAKVAVWQLGVILYEMATLTKLFSTNKNLFENIDMLIHCKYQPLDQVSGLRGRYSHQMSHAIAMMLTAEPSKRASIDQILKLPCMAGPLKAVLASEAFIKACNKNVISVDKEAFRDFKFGINQDIELPQIEREAPLAIRRNV